MNKNSSENEIQIDVLRHSLSHIMAAAVQKLWPDTQFAIGPSIDTGFYYDLDLGMDGGEKRKMSEEDLPRIEAAMADLIKADLPFERHELSVDEAIAKERAAGQTYKAELIADLKAAGETKVSYYRVGDFEDLCRGPHVATSAQLPMGGFALLKLAGAYWRGDERNKMLTRIYGLAFATKAELEAHKTMLAEAEKRDHRKLGKELGLFIFSDLVGPGLPIYTDRGALVRREIVNFSNELQTSIGYREVHTPNITKAELFKTSGHYEKYKEDMLRVVSNYTDEEYFLKPMNCPHHTQLYAAGLRSYKDLPIRIADFANLYRDEKPGELSGLTRLRCFSQDDGHCFCREDQIKAEFLAVLGIIEQALKVYGMTYRVRLSLWDPAQPEKYLGSHEVWEKSQKLLEEILVERGADYDRADGEAAIYGPKMDFISKDALGREWQISTIQLDFIMPERFGLTYVDADGTKKMPVMIHRAIIGSPERFIGILLEHYAGNFPVWLSPVQVSLLAVSEKHIDHCRSLAQELAQSGIRVEVDDSNETVGNKIRQAVGQKVPYLLVIGDKEAGSDMLMVRDRGSRDTRAISKADFIAEIREKVAGRK